MKISATIVTLNEERNIARAIASPIRMPVKEPGPMQAATRPIVEKPPSTRDITR